MTFCEIYHVAHNETFAWKWRLVGEDGRVTESKEIYPLFYDCVSAARASGYEPVVGQQSRSIVC